MPSKIIASPGINYNIISRLSLPLSLLSNHASGYFACEFLKINSAYFLTVKYTTSGHFQTRRCVLVCVCVCVYLNNNNKIDDDDDDNNDKAKFVPARN